MTAPSVAARSAARAIAKGEHGDPFSYLGMHADDDGVLLVRSFLPGAERVDVIDAGTERKVASLEAVGDDGLFAGRLGRRKRRFAYRLEVDGKVVEDPYRFGSHLSEEDLADLISGADTRTFRKLGAHPLTIEDVRGVRFALWAPNAHRVSVVGPFNDWDGKRHVMRKHPDCGIWEIFLPGIIEGTLYMYEIKSASGEILPPKADPYGFRAERRPETASIVWDISRRGRRPKRFAARAGLNAREAPIAIYEVHLGSWRRAENGEWLGYRDLAETLVPYIAEMGFTHVELLPVSEHPFDGSWGYQPIGMYAPTSRFGTPDDFRFMVEAFHQAGIGVLIDWVPGHFPNDRHGLERFDGGPLYEYADPRKGRHMDWGTLIYDYTRREVVDYLVSNAVYWLETFGLDGLRVDAVASMLYLDYSRKPGEWVPNEHGGNENLEAVSFLKRMNEAIYGLEVGATSFAEESTAWPMVSGPTYLGGLGFGYKWNMGWMHDTLAYMREDPVHRRHHHDKLTFGLVYAFSENFVLPLSHDEVVHGKGSLLGKMPGERWQRFANLRLYFGFMYTHPGKKLLFMGGEFGQEREWDHDGALDWRLLDDPNHAGVQRLVKDLNALYRSTPALHARDCEPDGFAWIDCNDADRSILTYLRKGAAADEICVAAGNFTPMVRKDMRIGVPRGGDWRMVLNTDDREYGGSGLGVVQSVAAQPVPCNGHAQSIVVTLPPLGLAAFSPAGRRKAGG